MAKSKKRTQTIQKKKPKSSPLKWAWLQQTSYLAAGLFLLSVLIYANTFKHDFAQDDAIVITENMFTTKGIEGIPGLFKYDTFFGFFKVEGKAKLVSGGRYRPLTPAMFAVEYQLFDGSPKAMHTLNALWYGLTVVVLYLLLLALFQARVKWDKNLNVTAIYWIPLLAAFIFAVHPLHTEAVANIKGRDEIITLLGSLTALWLMVKSRENNNYLLLVLAGVAFFLGLLAKENAITFLGVAPLTLYYFTKDSLSTIGKLVIPVFIAAVAFLAIRGQVLGEFDEKLHPNKFSYYKEFLFPDFGEPSKELMNNPFMKIENGKWVQLDFAEKLPTITYTLGKYAQLLVAPYPLTHDYYPKHIDLQSWNNIKVLLSLLLYIGLLVIGIRGLKEKSIPSFAIWFYLLTLSIVSNIVFPVGTNMSERFLFMPSVGFAILVAYLVYKYIPQWTNRTWALGVAGIIFIGMTIMRNPAWESNYSLFQTDVHTSFNSAKIQNAMAGELSVQWGKLSKEQKVQQKGLLNDALVHITEAIRIHPTYKQAYFIQGNILNNLDRYEEAIQSYLNARKIDPGYEDAFDNLMITYRDAGKYYGEVKGDVKTAISYLNQAYQALPNDYQTIRLLGVAHGISGHAEQAVSFFTKNTQLEPQSAYAWFDLATAYYQSGQTDAGQQALAKAQTIDPDIEAKVREGR